MVGETNKILGGGLRLCKNGPSYSATETNQILHNVNTDIGFKKLILTTEIHKTNDLYIVPCGVLVTIVTDVQFIGSMEFTGLEIDGFSYEYADNYRKQAIAYFEPTYVGKNVLIFFPCNQAIFNRLMNVEISYNPNYGIYQSFLWFDMNII